MKRITTIKKQLEAKGYTVIERDDTLVLAQELQKDTLTFKDGDMEFNFPPQICISENGHTYDSQVNDEVSAIAGEGWFWECEYSYCFKLYVA